MIYSRVFETICKLTGSIIVLTSKDIKCESTGLLPKDVDDGFHRFEIMIDGHSILSGSYNLRKAYFYYFLAHYYYQLKLSFNSDSRPVLLFTEKVIFGWNDHDVSDQKLLQLIEEYKTIN